jgi:hypothetical protein
MLVTDLAHFDDVINEFQAGGFFWLVKGDDSLH